MFTALSYMEVTDSGKGVSVLTISSCVCLQILNVEIVHLTFKIAGLKNSVIKILSFLWIMAPVLTNSSRVVFSDSGVSVSYGVVFV